MTKEIAKTVDYQTFIITLKNKVQAVQIKSARAVNTELLNLYWEIGQMITEKQKNSGWGDAVIKQIAKDLTSELGNIKGFSRSNLYSIKQWYDFYAKEKVQQLVGQIPWGHNILIIQKVKETEEAIWYAQKTLENNWSRNVLAHQIANNLYARQEKKSHINNFSEHLPSPNSDLANESLKDPYIFDFLNLGEKANEREIENALVEHLTKFMLELGKGFAFVGQQYHIEVGTQDFYIDLLFYHLKLHCYIAIELKTGPFKPEYIGKLNFYLTALDEQIKTPEDNPSIGLILCKDRNNVIAEYSLRDVSKPIGVSRYELATILPKELQDKLPTLEEVEAELNKDNR